MSTTVTLPNPITMPANVSGSVLKSVGAELAAYLPANDTPWWKKRNLLLLNYCMFSLLLLSSGNGYDGA